MEKSSRKAQITRTIDARSTAPNVAMPARRAVSPMRSEPCPGIATDLNVSNGEVVAEGTDHEDYRCEEHGAECSNAGAASGLADALRTMPEHCDRSECKQWRSRRGRHRSRGLSMRGARRRM